MTVLELTSTALDALRTQRDPPADAVVAEIRAAFPDVADRDVILSLVRPTRAVRGAGIDAVRAAPAPDDTASDLEAAAREAVAAWLADASALPDWALTDEAQARIRNGQTFFDDWSMPIAATLFCGSLPAAYAAANGVLVLHRSSDLAGSNVNRRVAETGQMLLDVMNLAAGPPSALQPGGQGYVSARGVRLLHAIIRFGIDHSDDWDADACGAPINQEDLLGTLFTFTTVVFRGMARLGLPFDDDPVKAARAEDYLFTWCVIGHLLGIDPALLHMDRAVADARMYQIAARQHRASPAGDELMAALLHEMELSMPWGLRTMPRALVRHLLDDEIADLLHVPRARLWQRVFAGAAAIDAVLARLPFGSSVLQMASEVVGRSMIRLYLDRALREDQPPFRVDAALLDKLALTKVEAGGTARHARRVCRRRIASTKIGVTRAVAGRLQGLPAAPVAGLQAALDRAELDARVWARQEPWRP